MLVFSSLLAGGMFASRSVSYSRNAAARWGGREGGSVWVCGRGALRSPFLPQRPLPPSCHPPSCPGTGKTTPERRVPRPRCPSGSRSALQTPRCLHTCSPGPSHGGGRPPGWGQRHSWPRCTSEKATGWPLSSPYCGAGASGTRGRFGPRLGARLRSPRGRAQ